MRIVLAASALALASVPTCAFAVDYLTAAQAETLLFPEADAFDAHTVALDAAQMQKLEAQGVRARSASWQVQVARHGPTTLGYIVIDNVLGKVELITYAVAIGLDGMIRQVEILSYRESHGFEIRLPSWRKQFVGKTSASPLHVGDDIANISGATLSSTHVTDGVKRIAAIVALARRSGALPA